MALMRKRHSIFVDEEEEELFSKEIDEIRNFKFSLGNQLRTGLFGQDACVQTDVSELPTVNLLSNSTAELIKEMDTLKKDIVVKMKFIQAQYESRLQQEAESLYTSINDKVKSLEKHHKEKVQVLRKSYQQQFSDAIHVVRASYKNYYLKRGDKVEEDGETTGRDAARLKDLMAEVQEKSLKMEAMAEQLREYEERALSATFAEVEDPEKDWLRSENDRLKDDVDSMHVDMEKVRSALQAKEQRLKDLALTVKELKAKAEEDKKALQKMTSDREQLKIQFAVEKEAGRKKMKDIKQEMEKEMKCKEEFRKSEKLALEKRTEEKLQAVEEKQRREVLLAQEAVLKNQSSARPATKVEAAQEELIEQLDEMKKAETVQKKHIEKLQKQLVRSNDIWEKKFDILKRSFHAIKDEMFLRQTLQRQAASLQHASVSYAVDSPFHHSPNGLRIPGHGAGTPLPNIGAGWHQKTDRTSQTRGTDAVSCSEPQLESGHDDDDDDDDDEEGDEELAGILPLPHPSCRVRQTASLPSAACTHTPL